MVAVMTKNLILRLKLQIPLVCVTQMPIKKAAWDAQMLALMDLPVAEDWKEEGNLVRFVMKLATKRFAECISLPVYDALSSWVSEQGFEFPTLLNRLGREPSEQVSDSGLPKNKMCWCLSKRSRVP